MFSSGELFVLSGDKHLHFPVYQFHRDGLIIASPAELHFLEEGERDRNRGANQNGQSNHTLSGQSTFTTPSRGSNHHRMISSIIAIKNRNILALNNPTAHPFTRTTPLVTICETAS